MIDPRLLAIDVQRAILNALRREVVRPFDCRLMDLSIEWRAIASVLVDASYPDACNPSIGDHDCPDSPIGKCVYDDFNFDDCLICNQPEERK